jgi:hypothetical protein
MESGLAIKNNKKTLICYHVKSKVNRILLG